MAKVGTKKAALVKSKTTEMAEVDPMFLEDSNIDNHMSKDDIAIPRLSILQDLSPSAIKRNAEYIKGAEAGMFADLTQGKIFSGEDGVIVIPVTYRRTYIEWKPRSDGGGFVNDHGIDDELLSTAVRDDKGALILPNKNKLVVTAEYVILLVNKDGITPAVMSLASSQLKKSRKWNTMITNYQIDHPKGGKFNPAMFYRAYRLTTIPESNDQGDWFGISIAPECDVISLPDGKEAYMKARTLRQQVDSGEVKVSVPASDSAGEDEDSPM
jgi:hypothetical protein